MSSGWWTALVLAPVWVMGALAAVDVIRRQDLGRARKVAWLAGLVAVSPLTLVYLLARPVGDVGTPASARLDPGDPRVRFTAALEAGDADAAAAVLEDGATRR